MSGSRAWAGDQVKVAAGPGAIVTGVREKGPGPVPVWMLRPLYSGTLHQGETDAPGTLTVIRRRAERIADP
ncbi:hypothetical protein [Streptomyces sp. DSM 40907]|uniref:hypothetical protein n=1 Tax=Streptomyces kutzneri TaxID=3051179 RepID=UPI0028D3BA89|nr:hypothetical protein [Streptomyces sp. DSM 40907]